jgi:glycosyltransferase involved in cell wall biosynthesis
MSKISATIITYNEESYISGCIDSLKTIADEIVVVDSFSQDSTKDICFKKNVRFVENAFKSHIEQKNFATSLTSFDHVISLDADERLSTQLIESILFIKDSWPAEAYRMNRLSTYGDKWIQRGNWYPDRQLRLWNKKIGHWGGKTPHESLVLNKNIKSMHLKGDILHEAYRDSYEALQKIQSYSDIFAKENLGKLDSSVFKIITHSSFTFFKSYIIKQGIFDGFEGLMVAMAEANHTFYKYAKLYEAERIMREKTKSSNSEDN